MAAQVGKYAANALLKKHMKEYSSKKVETGDVSLQICFRSAMAIDANFFLQDPYFAMIEDPRHPGRLKKVKKQVPAYIPEHDANILATVRRRAYRLDMSLFNLFGIRFGWEAVIGLIPFAGDAIGVFFAYTLMRKCCEIDGGLDNSVRMRMILNILVDFALGLVPFLGDLADAAFKCNTKNLRLLETVLDKKYKPSAQRRDERDGQDREKRRRNRQSGIYAPNDPPPATAFEDFSDEEYREQDSGHQQQQQQQSRRSWYGGGGGRKQPPARAPRPPPQETGTVRR